MSLLRLLIMKMKSLITLSIISTLALSTGCSSLIGYNMFVGSKNSVKKGISYEYDPFEQSGWLETESYSGNNEMPAASYLFRANFSKNEELSFIQIYVTTYTKDWCFINSVYGSDGKKYDFVAIDRYIDTSSGSVSTREVFAFKISKSQLDFWSDKQPEFKAVGKRCDAKIKIDERVSSAFLESLEMKL